VPIRPPEIVKTVANIFPANKMVRIIAVISRVFFSACFSTSTLSFL